MMIRSTTLVYYGCNTMVLISKIFFKDLSKEKGSCVMSLSINEVRGSHGNQGIRNVLKLHTRLVD
jgi:hypothetical protein